MTHLPDVDLLDLELDNGWLTLWFNSETNRNALSDQMVADLKGFSSAITNGASHEEVMELNKSAGYLFAKVNSMPQVVLAYVEGAAIAGGLGLMCCADVITVTDGAKFSLTETMLGIAPAQIAPIVVARIGLPAARRLMLTAARFAGTEALEVGLADYVVQDASEFEDFNFIQKLEH